MRYSPTLPQILLLPLSVLRGINVCLIPLVSTTTGVCICVAKDLGAYPRLYRSVLTLSIVHLLRNFTMALTQRFGNFQPFVRTTSRNDDRLGGLESGFVTYDKSDSLNEETYKVSSFEVAGRSDHLAAPVTQLVGGTYTQLSTSAPLDGDADLMREPEKKQTEAAA